MSAAAQPDPERGTVRVIVGRTAEKTKIEVFLGCGLGWAPLRGVTAVECRVASGKRGEILPTMHLTIETLFGHYFEMMTPAEKVALHLVGVSEDLVAAAREKALKV